MIEDKIPAFDEALGSETCGPAGYGFKEQSSSTSTLWVLT